MYKLLKHKNKKHPIRMDNFVIGEWQVETQKTDMQNLTLKDIYLLMWFSLQEGYEFAEQEFLMTKRDVKMMLDDPETIKQFLAMIPDFFPAAKKEDGTKNVKAPAKS